jgi:hypothetical protein
VNRAEFQRLANDRIADAKALLAAKRWAAAYYLAGYAVECALKSCVLARLSAEPEVVFQDRRFSERCWTHSLIQLVDLGEMDAEELWETTLDPAKRTLLRVNFDDALKADEMFRTLMVEKVEPRREFIQKHALEVKDIDYHGA